LSRFQSTSEVSEINRHAGSGSIRVSAGTYQVLSQAAEYSELYHGLFDVTVGPLLSLWQHGREESRPPRKSEIEQALALVDYSGLILDPDGQTARLSREGQSVDLGGIGKGFAGDRVRNRGCRA
jgi:thiamine biosynthesis lipoprotein